MNIIASSRNNLVDRMPSPDSSLSSLPDAPPSTLRKDHAMITGKQQLQTEVIPNRRRSCSASSEGSSGLFIQKSGSRSLPMGGARYVLPGLPFFRKWSNSTSDSREAATILRRTNDESCAFADPLDEFKRLDDPSHWVCGRCSYKNKVQKNTTIDCSCAGCGRPYVRSVPKRNVPARSVSADSYGLAPRLCSISSDSLSTSSAGSAGFQHTVVGGIPNNPFESNNNRPTAYPANAPNSIGADVVNGGHVVPQNPFAM